MLNLADSHFSHFFCFFSPVEWINCQLNSHFGSSSNLRLKSEQCESWGHISSQLDIFTHKKECHCEIRQNGALKNKTETVKWLSSVNCRQFSPQVSAGLEWFMTAPPVIADPLQCFLSSATLLKAFCLWISRRIALSAMLPVALQDKL